jgi:hypothetical protein
MAIISSSNFDKEDVNGAKMIETLVEGKSWVIIMGKISTDFRMLLVSRIEDLNEWEGVVK